MVHPIGIARSFIVKILLVLLASVTLSILLIAAISYFNIYEITEDNASIRVDRAARAATSLLTRTYPNTFAVERDPGGQPLRIDIMSEDPGAVLTYTDDFDGLLREIGLTNEGAANLFRWNGETQAFDRIVTTFRTPDGQIPPPMSIGKDHPAYANLSNSTAYVGEVPVMGRMRLAYLTPILTRDREVAGALAVDVGWADDLIVARGQIQKEVFGASLFILVLVAVCSGIIMHSATRPLREMAGFAEALADGKRLGPVPYLGRGDEVGDLARGLARVADLQAKLEHIAYTDPISGIGNRARFQADLEKAAANADTSPFMLVRIDFEGFSKINDAFGPAAGDSVLRKTGHRLKQCIPDGANAYRVFGDDFAVIFPLPSAIGEVEARGLVQPMLDTIAAPHILPEGEVHVLPNLGIARVPLDALDGDGAIRKAALALRNARKTIKSSIVFFSKELSIEANRQLSLESALRGSLAQGKLEVFYQPQVCLRRMKLKGFEALARWPDPNEGYISPADFIPIAEKTGLIIDLGTWVLDESCRQAKQWAQEGLPFDYVSVNVSPVQIWQPNFERIVEASLQRYHLPPSYLCLEITENVFIGHDEARMMEVLRKLRDLGVLLSLDDFGTGYSSLSYLNRLPFSQLKIDRAFVTGAHLDPGKEKLLRGMVNLGQTLGLKVITEGTEVIGEISLARQINCDGVQGFYYSRPVPACDIPDVIARINALPALVPARGNETVRSV
ncbi:hypothetical protein GCM10011316_34290 [Roseibium aquae]|uniref:Diguanylate cyclase/phosphodiesterase n=1 Tax=Roseibium aquae TaxID=1323746 RepID=A0A916TPV6_9HYPH|nr:EAL domain-containing protein [Roseibium aquae]GGB59395.1 hypothetical protein GCM10011316_34290 [Roseibium aquae]